MHPSGLVCHDLLCLGLRSLESGELSCPSQSFCQQVHGVVAKIMIRRLHLPPMYHKVYVSSCIATFLVLATVELFERAGTEGFWTCLSKHEWSGMWWKLTLFPKLRRASMVFLYVAETDCVSSLFLKYDLIIIVYNNLNHPPPLPYLLTSSSKAWTKKYDKKRSVAKMKVQVRTRAIR